MEIIIETVICKYCQTTFIYQRVKKAKQFCTTKCLTTYHAEQNRDPQKIEQYYNQHPAKRFLASTKHSAKKRGLIFSLNEAWFEKHLSSGHCELTGLPIQSKPYEKNARGSRTFYSPSIDRIDNNLGYIPSNCRIIAWGANQFKSQFTDRDINSFALAIVLRNLPKKCQSELLELMPANFVASLPSGHPFPVI